MPMLRYNELTTYMEPEELLYKGKSLSKPWKDAYYTSKEQYEDYVQFKPKVDAAIKYILGYKDAFTLPDGCANKIREYALNYNYKKLYEVLDANKIFLRDKLSTNRFKYLPAKLSYLYKAIESGLSDRPQESSEITVKIDDIEIFETYKKPKADVSKWLDEED